MRVAVIGAGFAGLSTAKVLTTFGHDVVVYEKAPDVGGVWSRTRRYPGLTTQNDKGTYALPDFPMPSHYPEWPTGEQVQAYLQSYAEKFGLIEKIRLCTEVVSAVPATGGGWTIHTTLGTDSVDHLVVANGIFSDPAVPQYPGTDEFQAAGGRLYHASEFTDSEDARDRDVVVIGYGKSACDVAVALARVASSTAVVARGLLWKQPRRVAGINFKYLLLTRLSEGLFPYIHPRGFERFLHGPGRPVRNAAFRILQRQYERQHKLVELGLLPKGTLERIARSTVSLVTEGFFEGVRDGTIVVHRDTAITRLGVRDGRPVAELATGAVLPADTLVCGTGFHQRVPFLPDDVDARIHDERGNFELFRQILPHDVPDLTFCGYNSSFFSPLSAEVAALWIATYLTGRLVLPPVAERRARVAQRLRWMEQRTEGKHARGTNIIPFSLHNVDEMLADLGVGVSRWRRLSEWFAPAKPQAYAHLCRILLARNASCFDATVTSAGPAASANGIGSMTSRTTAPDTEMTRAQSDALGLPMGKVVDDEIR
jgi:cation diffusion facilitator CzcD-associated flavoprotein CzcO